MMLSLEEAREWFEIRDHVREAVEQLEMCVHCGRVRDKSHLIRIRGQYRCRPDLRGDCWGDSAGRPRAAWEGTW